MLASIFFITDSLEKGSLIKLLIASRGRNCENNLSVSSLGNILKFNTPIIMASIIFHTKRNPNANAERFTKIPKNKQKEKKAVSLIK